MELQQSLLLVIEEAINAVVGLDPFARESFAELHGRRIAIDFEDWDLTLQFVPDASLDYRKAYLFSVRYR